MGITSGTEIALISPHTKKPRERRIKKRKNFLVRMPVMMGDFVYYEIKKLPPEKVLQILREKVNYIVSNKIYGAIGFHPWVLGLDKNRLKVFEQFLAEISDRDDIKILTFGEVFRELFGCLQ